MRSRRSCTQLAPGDGPVREADGDAVANDRLAFADVGKRHLVPLRHAFAQGQAGGEARAEHGPGFEAAGIGDDGHVVALVHADRMRRARGHGSGEAGQGRGNRRRHRRKSMPWRRTGRGTPLRRAA
jgi:hypothetical protein